MLPLSLLLLRYHKSPASPIIETNPTEAKTNINTQSFPTSSGNLLKMNCIVGLKNGNYQTKGELTCSVVTLKKFLLNNDVVLN